MKSERTSKVEVQTNPELSLSRAQGLLWKAFEFSQGNNLALRMSLAWIHNNYPAYKINDEVKQTIAERLGPSTDEYLKPGPNAHHVQVNIRTAEVITTIHNTADAMQRIFNFSGKLTPAKMFENGTYPYIYYIEVIATLG